ncbi:hypothetical protein CF326_g3866 [Tilletia indica]|nr:hypothetical protein CF326_g3866 [Tilletia indica]
MAGATSKAASRARPARPSSATDVPPTAKSNTAATADTVDDSSSIDGEHDESAEAEPAEEPEETASLALDISVKYLPSTKAKKGQGRAGAPQKKSSATRRIIDIAPGCTFKTFKKSICNALQRMETKYRIGTIKYDDLELEVKIPKGPSKWKKPLAIITDDTFNTFKTALFKSSEKYAESVVVLDEIDVEQIEGASSTESDSDVQLATTADRKRAAASSSSKATAKKAKSNQKTAIASVFSPRKETLKEIEEMYACIHSSCNPDGQCLVKDGRHIKLTKRKKQRFVAAVVDAGTHTVEDPPSVLFADSPPARGLGGSKRREPVTPTRTGTYTEDITITISSTSTATPQLVGKGKHRSTVSSFRANATVGDDDELKATVIIPELDPLHARMVLMIEDAARLLRLHEDTVRQLKAAGFVRVGQLARAYKNNFKRLVKEAKLTTSSLADVEELLLHWLSLQQPQLGPPEGLDDFNMFRDAFDPFGAADGQNNAYAANPYDNPPFSPPLPLYRAQDPAPVPPSSAARPDGPSGARLPGQIDGPSAA